MRSRGSIARLMLAIGLSALALTLLRGWLGPANRFGFLGLMAIMVLATLIAGLVTAGLVRRFFAGASATGTVLGVAVLIAPSAILDFCVNHLIIPVDRWANLPRTPGGMPGSGFTRLELMLLWAELGENHFDPDGRRSDNWLHDRTCLYGGMSELQAVLLIPPAVLSALGGLVAAIRRPRPTVPSSPVDRP